MTNPAEQQKHVEKKWAVKTATGFDFVTRSRPTANGYTKNENRTAGKNVARVVRVEIREL